MLYTKLAKFISVIKKDQPNRRFWCFVHSSKKRYRKKLQKIKQKRPKVTVKGGFFKKYFRNLKKIILKTYKGLRKANFSQKKNVEKIIKVKKNKKTKKFLTKIQLREFKKAKKIFARLIRKLKKFKLKLRYYKRKKIKSNKAILFLYMQIKHANVLKAKFKQMIIRMRKKKKTTKNQKFFWKMFIKKIKNKKKYLKTFLSQKKKNVKVQTFSPKIKKNTQFYQLKRLYFKSLKHKFKLLSKVAKFRQTLVT